MAHSSQSSCRQTDATFCHISGMDKGQDGYDSSDNAFYVSVFEIHEAALLRMPNFIYTTLNVLITENCWQTVKIQKI